MTSNVGTVSQPDQPVELTLNRGSLYLSGLIYERYFRDLEAVILLRKDDDLLVMPVMHAAAGGYLLKLKNTAGDRVINAMDFFRHHGMDEFNPIQFQVIWNTDSAALIAQDLFKTDN